MIVPWFVVHSYKLPHFVNVLSTQMKKMGYKPITYDFKEMREDASFVSLGGESTALSF